MQGIGSWIAGICATSLIVAVVSSVAPKNSAGRVCVMMGSVMVIVALLLPVLNISGRSLLDLGSDYQREIEKKIEETEKIKNDIIERELSSYVLNKAGAEENCKIYFSVENGAVVSADVVSSDASAEARVREVLKEEFKIEVEG